MSKYLGPIHFWLYQKVENQENLTRKIAGRAETEHWIQESERFIRELPELEDAIDESNIHGWLQDKLSDAEKRYADLVTTILAEHPDRLETLCSVAEAFGKEHGLSGEESPEKAYKAFEDFFLNGMPCDQVNRVLSVAPDRITWEMGEDIHAGAWPDKDTRVYYQLRKSIMDGMLADGALTVTMEEPFRYTMKRNGE